MDYNVINQYLKRGNVNSSILKNPSQSVCYDIMEMLKAAVIKFSDVNKQEQMMDYYLTNNVSIDEKGNVNIKYEANEKTDSIFRQSISHSIDEKGNYVKQSSSKMCSNDKDILGSYKTNYYMDEHIYDQNGIEMIENNKQCFQSTLSLDDARAYAENDWFMGSEEYDQRLMSMPASTCIKKVERNSDLGSAMVSYNGGLLRYGDATTIYQVFAVQLHGEHIDKLTIDFEANNEINNMFMQIHEGEINSNDVGRLAEKNPKLSFMVSDMTPVQKDNYYDWVNNEISCIKDDTKRTAMQNMALQRCIVSSTMSEVNTLVDAMVNGTVDVNGQPIVNQINENSNSRMMGFSGMWLLGLITGIMSCGILLISIFLK